MPLPMRFARLLSPLLLLLAAPALASPHSGVAKERTGPALSDLALFAMAAGGIWFAQRRLKSRNRKD